MNNDKLINKKKIIKMQICMFKRDIRFVNRLMKSDYKYYVFSD